MKERRRFDGRFKAQVVLEVLTGVKSAAQLCREHGLKETLLSRWKQEFIERSPELFESRRERNPQDERVAELERVIGRLTTNSHHPWPRYPNLVLDYLVTLPNEVWVVDILSNFVGPLHQL